MAIFASVVPRLATLATQHGIAIAAGVLSGAALGAAGVATGVIPVGSGSSGQTIALLACPGSGPTLARITSGQKLLVTARSADGTWLQIYIGQPGLDRAWAPTAALKLQDAVAGLPIAECGTPGPLPSPQPTAATASPSPPPSAETSPSLSSTPSASPKPTGTPKPTRTPKPTGTPFTDLTAPSITNLKTTGSPLGGDPSSGYWQVYRPSATCTPHQVTISATVTDPDDPIASVTLYYTTYGSTSELSAPMTKVGSTTTWQHVLVAQDAWIEGQITYHVNAIDAHGNSTDQLYDQELYNLYTQPC